MTNIKSDCHMKFFNIRGAAKKFQQMWYSTLMVGHTTTLT